ncbi:DMT family transporter [Nonomuraea sp. SBT364]|uniref:DMT family transporter n=1 Tax=Nonomuraea sp. SBT364 TaxID=1580530 RepID=UPI00066DE99B|nr:EamA family transporter [Nonomuraea sp. SBT364]
MTQLTTQLTTRRATWYVATAAAAWGTGGAAGALLFASGGLDALDVSFWRYLLGALFLLPLARGLRLDRRVVVVGVGMAVYQTAYFGAISCSGVAIATVVTMGATPVFTALGGRLLLGERLGRAGLAALLVALTGLLLLTAQPAGHATAPVASGTAATPFGVGLGLVSAAGYAGVTLYSRRHRAGSRGMAVGGFVVGAVCLAPFALAGGVLPEGGWQSVALLGYLGAVPTALAYGLFFRALTALRATTVSIVSLGEAAGAAVLGVLVFGERLTPLAWAGCVLLLVAAVARAREE